MNPLQGQKKLLSGGHQKGIGIFDGLSARLASLYDFDFLWLSSFSVSAAKGRPDMGLVSSTELCETTRDVQNNTHLPIVVDIDSGYGDLAYLHNFSRELLKSGIDGICIEDNPLSKRSSLYEIEERKIVSAEDHAKRLQVIKERIDTHHSACLLIARTEALVAGLGVEEALNRARLYESVGARAIFVQSCDETGNEIKEFLSSWKSTSSVFITPTKYVSVPIQELFDFGASHIIFANQVVRSAVHSIKNTLAQLQSVKCLKEIENSICSVREISEIVGAADLFNLEHTLAHTYP